MLVLEIDPADKIDMAELDCVSRHGCRAVQYLAAIGSDTEGRALWVEKVNQSSEPTGQGRVLARDTTGNAAPSYWGILFFPLNHRSGIWWK